MLSNALILKSVSSQRPEANQRSLSAGKSPLISLHELFSVTPDDWVTWVNITTSHGAAWWLNLQMRPDFTWSTWCRARALKDEPEVCQDDSELSSHLPDGGKKLEVFILLPWEGTMRLCSWSRQTTCNYLISAYGISNMNGARQVSVLALLIIFQTHFSNHFNTESDKLLLWMRNVLGADFQRACVCLLNTTTLSVIFRNRLSVCGTQYFSVSVLKCFIM